MLKMGKIKQNMPVLPEKLSMLQNSEQILLPGCTVDISIQDPKLKALLQSKMKRKPNWSFYIGLVHSCDVGTIGTAGTIHSYNRMGTEKITVFGVRRFRIKKIITKEPFILAEIIQIDNHNDCDDLRKDPKIKKLVDEILSIVCSIFEFDSSDFLETIENIPPCYIAEVCTKLINFSSDELLQILNSLDITEKLQTTIKLLKTKKNVAVYKKPRIIIKSRTAGVPNPEFKKLEDRIKKIKFLPNIETVVLSELKELAMITPMNPQYNILFSHLSLIADLPWNIQAEETLDLSKTENDLEIDHYGLEKVKRRILEYLAVRKLRKTSDKSHQGPVLCLVGPPGVGKTSIARSIAATLNRPFERVSLGGINNMTDIRGHRRTYIGAMPGRIIQALKRSGVKNPVILLDEIDKMTKGIHGDPAAALLEVLDPTQNKEFLDHYVNIPFDLSQILFVVTANVVNGLSSPLYDRLEIIRISGYTYLEKLQIAKKYLLPKQLEETGIHSKQIEILDETLQLLIHNYTHEAGVRALERSIGKLCRSVALQVALNETVDNKLNFPVIIDQSATKNILGPMLRENNKWTSRLGKPGVAIGLVVTSAGGDTISVESSFMPGNGKLILTGSLGAVMKESAKLAWAWVRSNSHMYGIEFSGEKLKSIDVHVHFPAGAISKDGPSAGITVAATLLSLFLDRPLLPNIAMTGEITLQGLVLGVGGVKEKVIAGHRDGFTKIIIPRENAKHLHDIPSSIKDDLTFVLVSDMHTVIETIFEDGDNLLIPDYIKSKL